MMGIELTLREAQGDKEKVLAINTGGETLEGWVVAVEDGCALIECFNETASTRWCVRVNDIKYVGWPMPPTPEQAAAREAAENERLEQVKAMEAAYVEQRAARIAAKEAKALMVDQQNNQKEVK